MTCREKCLQLRVFLHRAFFVLVASRISRNRFLSNRSVAQVEARLPRGRRKLSFVRLTSVLASPSLPGWSFVTTRNSAGNGQARSWTAEGYTTFKDSSRRTWNVSTIDDYCKNQRFDLYSIDSSWIFQDGPTVVQLCTVMLPAWLTGHREKLRSLHKFHAATS